MDNDTFQDSLLNMAIMFVCFGNVCRRFSMLRIICDELYGCQDETSKNEVAEPSTPLDGTDGFSPKAKATAEPGVHSHTQSGT